MTISRQPLVSDLIPEQYDTNGIIISSSGTKNMLFTKYSGDKMYGEQRPVLSVTRDPTLNGLSYGTGQGMYYWEGVDDTYIVHNNKVYKGNYSTSLGFVVASNGKCFFTLVGTQLVITCPETGYGYYIDQATPTILRNITAANWPGTSAASGLGKDLAGGAVSLDGYLFVMTTDGIVYNSNLNAVQTWTASDFIEADILSDGGVYLAKHHNHICAIGSNSIQFFSDAGNPVGSPLQVRRDIAYLSGGVDRDSVSESGDSIFFVGRHTTGTAGVFLIEDFRISKVSTDSIDEFLLNSYAVLSDPTFATKFILASSWLSGHLVCFVTEIRMTFEGHLGDAQQTVVFDNTNKIWSEFDTGLSSLNAFEIISAPASLLNKNSVSGASQGSVTEVMFATGVTAEIIAPKKDAGNISLIRDRDTFNSEYIPVPIRIITEENDFGTMTDKFAYRLSIVGDTTSNSSDATDIMLSWSDDHHRTFSTPRAISTGINKSIPRLGSFKRRSWKLEYSGLDMLRIEALEIDIRGSKYA